jgi:hypothetical protein
MEGKLRSRKGEVGVDSPLAMDDLVGETVGVAVSL